jgi:hypothetical protein
MLQEDFGPDGKKLAVTGAAQCPVVVCEGDRWRLRTATVRFSSGFLDAIEIDGKAVECPKGAYGPSVTIHVCANLKTDAYGRRGDVWRMSWVDGLLIENQRILTDVDVL